MSGIIGNGYGFIALPVMQIDTVISGDFIRSITGKRRNRNGCCGYRCGSLFSMLFLMFAHWSVHLLPLGSRLFADCNQVCIRPFLHDLIGAALNVLLLMPRCGDSIQLTRDSDQFPDSMIADSVYLQKRIDHIAQFCHIAHQLNEIAVLQNNAVSVLLVRAMCMITAGTVRGEDNPWGSDYDLPAAVPG